jgi:hypothetical protein
MDKKNTKDNIISHAIQLFYETDMKKRLCGKSRKRADIRMWLSGIIIKTKRKLPTF